MVISSRTNGTVKKIAALKDKKARKESGLYVVEGRKMVKEAYDNGSKIEMIVGTEKALSALNIDFQSKSGENIEVITVTEEVFPAMCDAVTPQGVLAVLKEPQLNLQPPIKPCSILLDGIADPGNLGTIIRTAAAAGVSEIYLAECCDPYSPKVVRSSMSGIFFTSLYRSDKASILNCLKGIPLIVADMDGVNVFEFDPPKKFCLVIGNEANGVSKEVENLSNLTVKIPMSDKMESLNAGVSCAVMLYELTSGKGRSLI